MSSDAPMMEAMGVLSSCVTLEVNSWRTASASRRRSIWSSSWAFCVFRCETRGASSLYGASASGSVGSISRMGRTSRRASALEANQLRTIIEASTANTMPTDDHKSASTPARSSAILSTRPSSRRTAS